MRFGAYKTPVVHSTKTIVKFFPITQRTITIAANKIAGTMNISAFSINGNVLYPSDRM
jgi:hypothetical protein